MSTMKHVWRCRGCGELTEDPVFDRGPTETPLCLVCAEGVTA